MPRSFPREFHDDVVRVAQQRDPEVTLAQIAKDFGVHVGALDAHERRTHAECRGETRSLAMAQVRDRRSCSCA